MRMNDSFVKKSNSPQRRKERREEFKFKSIKLVLRCEKLNHIESDIKSLYPLRLGDEILSFFQ